MRQSYLTKNELPLINKFIYSAKRVRYNPSIYRHSVSRVIRLLAGCNRKSAEASQAPSALSEVYETDYKKQKGLTGSFIKREIRVSIALSYTLGLLV